MFPIQGAVTCHATQVQFNPEMGGHVTPSRYNRVIVIMGEHLETSGVSLSRGAGVRQREQCESEIRDACNIDSFGLLGGLC